MHAVIILTNTMASKEGVKNEPETVLTDFRQKYVYAFM